MVLAVDFWGSASENVEPPELSRPDFDYLITAGIRDEYDAIDQIVITEWRLQNCGSEVSEGEKHLAECCEILVDNRICQTILHSLLKKRDGESEQEPEVVVHRRRLMYRPVYKRIGRYVQVNMPAAPPRK